MKNNQKIEKLAKELKVSRQRIYQLLRQEYLKGNVKKDSESKYVIDGNAVDALKSDYKKKSRLAYNSKGAIVKRLSNEIRQRKEENKKLELEINKLKQENIQLKQKSEDSDQIIASKDDLIKTLKVNQENTKSFQDTIQDLARNMYLDKLPQLREASPKQKQDSQTTTPEAEKSTKHWWEKLF